jgi:hypothetical protein
MLETGQSFPVSNIGNNTKKTVYWGIITIISNPRIQLPEAKLCLDLEILCHRKLPNTCEFM